MGVLINLMKFRNRYLPWLLMISAVLTVTFVVLRRHNRVQWLAIYPEDGQEISIYGKFGLTFNQPMDTASVEERFSLQPSLAGDFTWEGNALWFVPQAPLDPAQVYQASISSGVKAKNGRALRGTITWQIAVREPELLYLVLGEAGGDLWRLDLASGQTDPLTNTNANVIDFSPSTTGDRITYAQNNAGGGSDLWLINRDGTNLQQLLDCQLDQCSQPTWSPDGEWIAYTRESFNMDEDRRMPSRVWTVSTLNGETAPLYIQEQAHGHSPSFSPDGKRLATYDSVQNAIRIIELESSQESLIPTAYSGVGDWSPDGEELIFIDLVPGVLEPNIGMYIVNFVNQDVRDVFDEFIPNIDYDPPRWSPDGDWIAYGVRPVGGGISKGIWIKDMSGDEVFPLTDDPSATFIGYRWDPWGEKLVFQRFPISGPRSHASLWIWERASGEIHLLIENGARPEWLP